MTTCESCTKPVADQAYLCTSCGETVVKDLDIVVDLYGYLDDTIAKQTKTSRGGRVGGRSSETPTPFNPAASTAADSIKTTIAQLAEAIIEDGRDFYIRMTPMTGLTCQQQQRLGLRYGDPVGPATAPGDFGACGHATCDAIMTGDVEPLTVQRARWIGGQLDWIRHNTNAMTIKRHVRNAAAELERHVDRPQDRRFLGPCGHPGVHLAACDCGDRNRCGNVGECVELIYAKAESKAARCSYCSTRHDVAQRTRDNLELARDRLYTATEIERLTGGLAKPVKAGRVWKWKERGKILAHGHNEAGQPMYLLGDAIDIVTDERVAEQVKAAKETA